jgi:hypothetical protein
MPWEVHITGPADILQELSQPLLDDPSVVAQGDGWIFRSQVFDRESDANEVRNQAERIVDCLSTISRLLLQNESPLKVLSLVEVRAGGRRDVFVQLESEGIRVRGGLVTPSIGQADGAVTVTRPSALAPKWLAKAERNPEIARALRLRNAQKLMWTDLHRLYEVLRAEVGGDAAIVKSGWTSKSQIERFTRSADSVAVAGDDARHGVERMQPPAKPMTLSQARSFIDALLGKWLDA